MAVNTILPECREVVFHFNTGYLKDPTIPMWIIKAKGITYYVERVISDAPWTTKETPDNKTTKASVKVKKVRVEIINDIAYLYDLKQENWKGKSDIKFKGKDFYFEPLPADFTDWLEETETKHSPIIKKEYEGGCNDTYFVFKIRIADVHLPMFLLKWHDYYDEDYDF